MDPTPEEIEAEKQRIKEENALAMLRRKTKKRRYIYRGRAPVTTNPTHLRRTKSVDY